MQKTSKRDGTTDESYAGISDGPPLPKSFIEACLHKFWAGSNDRKYRTPVQRKVWLYVKQTSSMKPIPFKRSFRAKQLDHDGKEFLYRVRCNLRGDLQKESISIRSRFMPRHDAILSLRVQMFPMPIFTVIWTPELRWSSLPTLQARKLCRVMFAYCISQYMGPIKLEIFRVPYCMRLSYLSDFNNQLWKAVFIFAPKMSRLSYLPLLSMACSLP